MAKQQKRIGKLKVPKDENKMLMFTMTQFKEIKGESSEERKERFQEWKIERAEKISKLTKQAIEYGEKVFDLNKSKLMQYGRTEEEARKNFSRQYAGLLNTYVVETKTKDNIIARGRKQQTIQKIQDTDMFNFGVSNDSIKNKRFAMNIIKGQKLEKDIKEMIYGTSRFKSLDFNNAVYGGSGKREEDGKELNFELVRYSDNGKMVNILITYRGKYNNEKDIKFVSDTTYEYWKQYVD